MDREREIDRDANPLTAAGTAYSLCRRPERADKVAIWWINVFPALGRERRTDLQKANK